MTDIENDDLQYRAMLVLLRELNRGAAIPVPEGEVSMPFLLPALEERGMVYRQYGGQVTISMAGQNLLDAIEARGARMLAEYDPCPYTHSHTRHWCGRDYCRES